MSYRVEYSCFPETTETAPKRGRHLTMLFFAAFLALVWNFWPEGKDMLLHLMWPFDDTLTAQAGEAFLKAAQCGASLSQAVEGFCSIMVQGAAVGH